MTRQELLQKIDKIFRANTIEKEVVVGQYDQTKTVKVIGDIEELKTDIKDLISNEFKVGEICKGDVFNGCGKIGGSYHISTPIAVAKEWGYKYLQFNERVFTIEGKDTGINYDEL